MGVGFGTGRHLSLRKSNEKIRSQEQSPIKETVATKEGHENIYKIGNKYPFNSTTTREIGVSALINSYNISPQNRPEFKSTGNDAISHYVTNKAISLRT